MFDCHVLERHVNLDGVGIGAALLAIFLATQLEEKNTLFLVLKELVESFLLPLNHNFLNNQC